MDVSASHNIQNTNDGTLRIGVKEWNMRIWQTKRLLHVKVMAIIEAILL